MENNLEMLLKQAQGNSYWVLGDLYSFKTTGKQTNGAFTVIDQVIQPQGGPPPHIHHREDEAFYILEGRFSFLKGNEQSILETGAFVYIPKGTVHTFKNLSEQHGRLLVIITPAGLEEFFYTIGTPSNGSATPPAFDPALMPKLLQLAKNYQMDILLPENR
jgi:mannose-6-phosphate isomerase-like protein (cupin superfamily)